MSDIKDLTEKYEKLVKKEARAWAAVEEAERNFASLQAEHEEIAEEMNNAKEALDAAIFRKEANHE